MKNLLFTLLLSIISLPSFAQQAQTIRGTVVDAETQFPLIGANVSVTLPDGTVIGATTDVNGLYRIEAVPLGRQKVDFSYLGYRPLVRDNIVVNSAKEVILNVELTESIEVLGEVVVNAKKNGEVTNEMAMVSAREFSVQETNRYAGSRGEPARMASNFAGVQGADDARNDIVIRGNSPLGVLWRLDGVNIPNPNHFSIPGTGGGPVTILNNKFLANSDFFTGAFPAAYGNAVAGVFDLKMRNGNNEQHEFSAQLGFLGTELTAEGPINKEKRSSYLAMYRYSTIQLFSFLGINVGTDAIPKYQDGAFRLNFPSKNGGNLSIYGMGGYSTVDIILSEAEKPDTSTLIFGQNDRDQYFASQMYVGGINYSLPLNANSYVKMGISASNSKVVASHDQIFRHVENGLYVIDSLPRILNYTFRENKYGAFFRYHKKWSAQSSLQVGINVDLYDYHFLDSARVVVPVPGGPTHIEDWRYRWDADGFALLVQPFVQWKYHFNEKMSMTAGVTSLLYTLNKNSFSPFEPRLGMTYKLSPKQKVSLGLGLHSQTQSNYLYFHSNRLKDGKLDTYNKGMGLTKSFHFVLSYDRQLGPVSRLKVETYYQSLFDIPVEQQASSFSLVNTGAGFTRFFPQPLTNTGTGRNYGVELTVERFFSKGFYFLITGSLFDAKYKGSDGVLRNTSFNGRYAGNILLAKEFTFKNKNTLNIGAKVTTAGGRWYGPVDEVASAQELEIIYKDETVNTLQFRPYFRADAKINYKINAKKVTHEFSVDLVNFLNIKNILTLTYAPDHPSGNPIREEYQLGFLPIFYYKLDF